MSDNLPAGVTDYDVDCSQGYDPRVEAREELERKADALYDRMRDDDPHGAWFYEVRDRAMRQYAAPELYPKITRDNAAAEVSAYASDAVSTLHCDVAAPIKRLDVVQLMAACLRVLDVLEAE